MFFLSCRPFILNVCGRGWYYGTGVRFLLGAFHYCFIRPLIQFCIYSICLVCTLWCSLFSPSVWSQRSPMLLFRGTLYTFFMFAVFFLTFESDGPHHCSRCRRYDFPLNASLACLWLNIVFCLSDNHCEGICLICVSVFYITRLSTTQDLTYEFYNLTFACWLLDRRYPLPKLWHLKYVTQKYCRNFPVKYTSWNAHIMQCFALLCFHITVNRSCTLCWLLRSPENGRFSWYFTST